MENLVDFQSINTKDDSINLYANIDTNCNEYNSIYSWQTIDTVIPIATTDSNKECIQLASGFIRPNNTHINPSSIEINQKYVPNPCNAYKSLPNILLTSKSNKMFLLHASKSLPSCLKFLQEQFPYYKRISMFNILNTEKKKINIIKKKKSNPTIGDLLGDNDLFHYHYHHQYSSPRSKRKRYQYYQSHRHSSYTNDTYIHVQHGRRKQQRSNYFNRIKESQHQYPSEIIQSRPPTSQIYINPTTYSCTPLPSYCSYYYSNMISYCPCLMSDFYTGLYQQELCYETSTSQNHYQRSEQHNPSDCCYHDEKRSY